MKVYRRTVELDSVEFNENEDCADCNGAGCSECERSSTTCVVRGHAAVFDSLSENLGGFVERIQRGAFRKILRTNPDVRLLVNHDANLVLARTTSGTLRLVEDEKGLSFEADLDLRQSYAADLKIALDRGDISQCSFAFSMGEDDYEVRQEDGQTVQIIRNFSGQHDVAVVTYPAYAATTVSARSILGTQVFTEDGHVEVDALRALAWQVHRGEVEATDVARAEIDTAFRTHTNTVSPWVAEQALLAVDSSDEKRQADTHTDTEETPDAAVQGESENDSQQRKRRLTVLLLERTD